MLYVDDAIGHDHDLSVGRSHSGVAEAEGAAAGSNDEAAHSEWNLLSLAAGRFDDDDGCRVENALVEIQG